jgi:ribonuclease HI
MRYKIWCDGAYKPSLEQGGIGIVWTKNGEIIKTYSKGYKKTSANKVTNQTMEMLAAMVALNAIKAPVDSIEIITDSMYVVGTMMKGWKRKANRELWAKFDSILEKTQILCKEKIVFMHTYGHAEDEFNNIADELADTASKELLL